jgi:hypothetical protein
MVIWKENLRNRQEYLLDFTIIFTPCVSFFYGFKGFSLIAEVVTEIYPKLLHFINRIPFIIHRFRIILENQLVKFF